MVSRIMCECKLSENGAMFMYILFIIYFSAHVWSSSWVSYLGGKVEAHASPQAADSQKTASCRSQHPCESALAPD
jgi:hypothetical protein